MGYYHVVFTPPAPISDIAYYNKTVVYGLLFEIAAETLNTIAADPKHLEAEVGATLMCTASSRAADSRRMASDGCRASLGSSYPYGCSHACFGAGFWKHWRRHIARASCSSSLMATLNSSTYGHHFSPTSLGQKAEPFAQLLAPRSG